MQAEEEASSFLVVSIFFSEIAVKVISQEGICSEVFEV